MLVVTVDFRIKPRFVEAFRAEMLANARASRAYEPGCHCFDVAFSDPDPTLVFLYELYDDAASFAAHQQTDHFKSFDKVTAGWIDRKAARLFTLVDSGQAAV
jgi:(4S)-4-hydroxy-5-phosphonooxypentane-2,3-dione isomerase